MQIVFSSILAVANAGILAAPYAVGALPVAYSGAPFAVVPQYQTPYEAGKGSAVVSGYFNYINANGIPERLSYTTDSSGYREETTNLSIAPVYRGVALVNTGIALKPVEDTTEGAEAMNRKKRSVIAPLAYSTALPYATATNAVALPFARGFGFSIVTNHGLNYAPW